jgi:catalase
MTISKVDGPFAKCIAKPLMCVSVLLASAAATADNAPLPTQIVDLANKVDGVHPGFRAFHAKGVVVEGTFKASAEAAHLSRASLFTGRTIPVTARFSDGSGMPGVPDGTPAMPRGIAIKYHLAGGPDTDMVTNSFKFFPVGTGEDFRDLLQAITASPPDAPKPTKLDEFFASHPNAPKAIGSLPIPDSFADEEYHGIDAFIFVDKSGRRQAVRYVIAPEKLVHITPEEAAKQSPDYLFDDLAQRIARKPVVFHVITAAAPGSAVGALIVSDIKAAHAEFVRRGVATSEMWHGAPFPVEARLPGPDPKRTSYGSFFAFNDPDGNAWLVQEVTTRLPGRT